MIRPPSNPDVVQFLGAEIVEFHRVAEGDRTNRAAHVPATRQDPRHLALFLDDAKGQGVVRLFGLDAEIGPERWRERSRTLLGIAAAMVAQWG
jgi:hypothetical protein